jgi:integrase
LRKKSFPPSAAGGYRKSIGRMLSNGSMPSLTGPRPLPRTARWAGSRASATLRSSAASSTFRRSPEPRPAAETARDRVLSDDELKAVWEAADALEPVYARFIKLLILTGQRLREVSELRWKETDLEKRVWTLPKERAKNGVEHTIPLSDQTIYILTACPRIAESDFVFTLTGRRSIQGHHLIKRRLDALMPPDTPPWVLHDIRRTVASGMAKLGINLPVIEKLLNHVSGSFAGIVGVYQRHSFSDEKRAAMTAWSRFVEQLAIGEMGNVVQLRERQ